MDEELLPSKDEGERRAAQSTWSRIECSQVQTHTQDVFRGQVRYTIQGHEILTKHTMRTFEYNALINSIDALKDADAAFSKDYFNNPISEEQISLYRDLLWKMDDVYSIAGMIIENEMYARDERKRKYRNRRQKE